MTLKLPVLTLKAISTVPVTKDSLEMVLSAQVCVCRYDSTHDCITAI